MIVCFDIGGTAIKGAYARTPEAIQPLPRIATPGHDLDAFVAALASVVDAAPEPVEAVSLSIAGVIDPDTRQAIVANIPCIHGIRLQEELERRLSLPVVIANDADCFAMAEAGFGAGQGHDVVFGVILGSGVGGGLVVRGRLINEGGGYAGEWGHGPISATIAGAARHSVPQFACGCGQTGCLDAIGSARGLERLDKHLHARELSSIDIISAWEQGEDKAAETIDVHIDILSGPLAVLINATGASRIPVGGGLSNSKALIGRLDTATRAKTLRRFSGPLVVPAACTIEPGLIGSAILGFQRVAQG
ncbi:ROK family protein [Roseibium suaedae]|uniref:N-acetylglucosamine kinase n=1 Tax=Roseibium suaedae TaxID=735517 RepID=A0A1M7I1E3_9HYPH|nr:ROK family protein [Roseibium suaedae]SHM34478.1 N-acetylglucosamine kinase [Roseibium suaedae]